MVFCIFFAIFIIAVQAIYVLEIHWSVYLQRHSFLKTMYFGCGLKLHSSRKNGCGWFYSSVFSVMPFISFHYENVVFSFISFFFLSFFKSCQVLHDLPCDKELSSWGYYPDRKLKKQRGGLVGTFLSRPHNAAGNRRCGAELWPPVLSRRLGPLTGWGYWFQFW